jgi:hypothetical protein
VLCCVRALLEEALQLERQLHVALLADKLNKQEEDKEHKQQQQQQREEGEEGQEGQDADAAAAAADSLAIPGVYMCVCMHLLRLKCQIWLASRTPAGPACMHALSTSAL